MFPSGEQPRVASKCDISSSFIQLYTFNCALNETTVWQLATGEEINDTGRTKQMNLTPSNAGKPSKEKNASLFHYPFGTFFINFLGISVTVYCFYDIYLSINMYVSCIV